jgi:hypothetical protein
MCTSALLHSRLFCATYALSRCRSVSICPSGVSYATVRFVVSHLRRASALDGAAVTASQAYIDELRRRLWMSFELVSNDVGTMTSIPSTRRNVTQKRPNSFTKRICVHG